MAFNWLENKNLVAVLLFSCSNAVGEVVSSGKNGEILYRDERGVVKVYAGIAGDKDGFDRALIMLNGKPALQVGLRHDSYYTLSFDGEGVSIDCAYHDERNKYNGARLTAGVCGLGADLDQDYSGIAQSYSDRWWSKVFSFDTSVVYKDGRAASFLLDKIGGVNVYDRYASAESLESAAPEKIIKSPNGCFYFDDNTVFITFLEGEVPRLKYLDVLVSQSPMVLKRLGEIELMALAVEKCSK